MGVHRSLLCAPSLQLIKDIRTGHESSNVDKVLGGDLNAYMEAFFAQQAENTGNKYRQTLGGIAAPKERSANALLWPCAIVCFHVDL